MENKENINNFNNNFVDLDENTDNFKHLNKDKLSFEYENVQKRKNNRIKKLNRIFKDVNADSKEVCSKLIEQCAFIEEELMQLIDDIETNGVVDEYCNGKNQYGRKKSVAVETYIKLLGSYNSCIKTLLSQLPSDSVKQAKQLMDENVNDLKQFCDFK